MTPKLAYLLEQSLLPRAGDLTARELKLYSFFEAWQCCVDSRAGRPHRVVEHPGFYYPYEYRVEYWTKGLMTAEDTDHFVQLGYDICNHMNDNEQEKMIDYIGSLQTAKLRDKEALQCIVTKGEEILMAA